MLSNETARNHTDYAEARNLAQVKLEGRRRCRGA